MNICTQQKQNYTFQYFLLIIPVILIKEKVLNNHYGPNKHSRINVVQTL